MNIIFLDIDGVLNTNYFDTKVSTDNKIYFHEYNIIIEQTINSKLNRENEIKNWLK